MMSRVIILAGTAVSSAFLALAAPASAAGVTYVDYLNYFNSITFGDLSTGHDIEGRTYVGGNFDAPATQVNIKPELSPSPFPEVVVRGDLNLSGDLKVENGGDLAVYGDVTGTSKLIPNGNGSIRVGGTSTAAVDVAVDIQTGLSGQAAFEALFPTDIEAVFTTASAGLAALDATGTVDASDMNALVFNSAPDADGLTVYNIDWTAFSNSNQSIQFNLAGADTVIVNVFGNGAGDGFSIFNNFNASSTISQHVLWNFVDATALNFNRSFWGAVIAPLALITNVTPIEGSVVARAGNYDGEIHVHGWHGQDPLPPAPVPVPAALPLLGAGLAGLALLRRRSRRR